MSEMIGKQFDDYEIVGKIGKGGMGSVYKGRQISLHRDVAIKILASNLTEDEEFVSRFEIEARSVAQLNHPNIIQVHGKGMTDDGHHYLAMEFVDGEDLSCKLKRGDRFSEEEAIDIIIQACRGLENAWENNIIHRDIKPGNIIIKKNGVVKIADFGLAKCLDASIELTKTGVFMGTVHYSSPEQGLGKRLDHRTDIYSLGIVLFRLLTEKLPFHAESPSAVIYQHIYEQPPLPKKINPGISSSIEAVVLKSIAKKPEDRYQNMVEFRKALEAVKHDLKMAKKPAPRESIWTWKTIAIAVIPLLIMLIGGAVWYSLIGPKDNENVVVTVDNEKEMLKGAIIEISNADSVKAVNAFRDRYLSKFESSEYKDELNDHADARIKYMSILKDIENAGGLQRLNSIKAGISSFEKENEGHSSVSALNTEWNGKFKVLMAEEQRKLDVAKENILTAFAGRNIGKVEDVRDEYLEKLELEGDRGILKDFAGDKIDAIKNAEKLISEKKIKETNAFSDAKSRIENAKTKYGTNRILLEFKNEYPDSNYKIQLEEKASLKTAMLEREKGSVRIESSPSTAKIYIDSIFSGTTPDTIRFLAPGVHEVEVKMDGYQKWSKNVNVKAGGELTLSARLKMLAGSISVKSGSDSAKIYLDGSYKGTTPDIMSDLTPGSYKVEIKLDGHKTWEDTVNVESGETIQVFARLEDAKEKMERIQLKPSRISLRSSYRDMSMLQVKSMPNMSIYEEFDDWGFNGYSTINHNYELKTISQDKVIIDHATGLMWHQSGSDDWLDWEEAKEWVKKLNNRSYAEYNDWRLPTVEEAVSLVELNKMGGGLHIYHFFDDEQISFFTGDKKDGPDGGAWSVTIDGDDNDGGLVSWSSLDDYRDINYVRPVRSLARSEIAQSYTRPSRISLRSSYRDVSISQVQSIPNMLIREKTDYGFEGFSIIDHDYKVRIISNDYVVIDHATGLMWHQSGTTDVLSWKEAKEWVRDLNNRGFAGFRNWRLPTLEEAASLLDSSDINGYYIDSVFDEEQDGIWTGDKHGSDIWCVAFDIGEVRGCDFDDIAYVRPVRSFK